jgi:glutamate synthase domain-containing protein 3
MTKGLVLCLGSTGRNFGAGMSGGIAYVLDETGEFQTNLCNRSSVDLDPVESAEDINTLKQLLERHWQYTSSPKARWVLDEFGKFLPKFVKVFPHEFKRVLGVARTPISTPQPAKSAKREVIHG